MSKLTLVSALLIILMLPFLSIISVHCAVTFTPEDKFVISGYNNQISFSIRGSYESATLENITWNFVGLALDNYILNTTAGGGSYGVVYGRDVLRYSLNDGNISISVQNCNITITNYDILLSYAPKSGWLNYTVNKAGTQTFNFFYSPVDFESLSWTVYIDGENKLKNENWTITNDKTISITNANKNCSIYYERTKPTSNRGEPNDQNLFDNNIGIVIFSVTLIILAILISVLKLMQKTQKNPLLI